MREVKATADGRMVHVMIEATSQITRTALRGWPAGETFDTHDEKGRTPSRATAKTRREAATIAMAVFLWGGVLVWWVGWGWRRTYKPESDDADYVHEYVASLT
jgi:hypothetical protein